MDRLVAAQRLTIVQKREWGEILTGFEGRNRYAVLDDAGNPIYAVGEHGGSLLARWFLKAMRPFTLELQTLEGKPLLRIRRPFRFYFHEASIEEASGRPLGSIRKQFSLLRRHYTIVDAQGMERFSLLGPLLRPWTFLIRPPSGASAYAVGTEGKIAKKWSGLLKEAFTDADHFGLEFPAGADATGRALLLGAVFLIDFVHFENKGN